HRAARVTLHPIVWCEDLFPLLRRHARTLVTHGECPMIPRSGRRHSHLLPRSPITHRVVEQVEQHLTQRVTVDGSHDVTFEPRLDSHAMRFSQWREARYDLFDFGGDVRAD